MSVFTVFHYVEYANEDSVSVHRTIQGASIAAYAYAVRTFRSTSGAYGPDPDTQWEADDLPYWQWSGHKVYVMESELER